MASWLKHSSPDRVACKGGRKKGGKGSYGSSGPGWSPGQGHCVVFLGKTLNSLSASLHPGV